MKYLKYIGIGALVLGFMFSMAYYIKTNSRSAITYETEKLSYETIEDKIVATGSVIPEDEVNIVPQISGIIDEIYVEEGEEVNEGDLLAKIKVVPNEQALNSAEGRVKTSRIILNNSKKEFDRNKKLFDKGVISEQEFNSIELRYNQDAQNLDNAISDLQIIKLGSIGGSAATNTIVRSTVKGTVLVVPIKEGDQVIEANTFNPGTTITSGEGLLEFAETGLNKSATSHCPFWVGILIDWTRTFPHEDWTFEARYPATNNIINMTRYFFIRIWKILFLKLL